MTFSKITRSCAAILVPALASVIEAQAQRYPCELLHGAPPEQVTTAVNLRAGDYLDVRYMALVRDTLSLDKADRGAPCPMFDRSRSRLSPGEPDPFGSCPLARLCEDGHVAIGNFVEGEFNFTLHPDGSATTYNAQDEGCRVVVISDSRFSFQQRVRGPAAEFEFVDDVDEWTANVLFVGEYKDQQDRRYFFKAHGVLQLPEKTTKYSLHGEESGFEADTVYIDGKLYRFVRSTTELLLIEPLPDRQVGSERVAYKLRLVKHGGP